MTESFSVDNLRAFVEAMLAGELTPKIKEEPDYSSDAGGYGDEEEEDDSDSAGVTVTSDNFDEVVSPTSDVMIEFYAPWCGHCQQLKPVYKELASKFETVESVTVAAMDATAHDPPEGYDVQGYPTVMFVPAGGSPVSYDGPRDVESMESYIRENAAVAIKDEL